MRKYLKYVFLMILSSILLFVGGCSGALEAASSPLSVETESGYVLTESEIESETTAGELPDEKGSVSDERRCGFVYLYLRKAAGKFHNKKRSEETWMGRRFSGSLMLPEWLSEATGSETMKVCFLKKMAFLIQSVILIR